MKIIEQITKDGFILINNVFDEDEIPLIRKDLQNALVKETAYHKTTDYYYYGSLLLAPIYGGAFLNIFENEKFYLPFEELLGEECIVYAYTSSSIPPKSSIYTKRIHVDSPRIIENYFTSLVGMVLVDDFTIENGAPFFLPNSQFMEEKPDEDYFYKHAVQITGKAGDVIYFNPRIWHSGGKNDTNFWRHSIIMGMQRAWMKQRFDIPRALADMDLTKLSQKSLQKFGFFSQPPVSYDDYYMPSEKRMFKQKTV